MSESLSPLPDLLFFSISFSCNRDFLHITFCLTNLPKVFELDGGTVMGSSAKSSDSTVKAPSMTVESSEEISSSVSVKSVSVRKASPPVSVESVEEVPSPASGESRGGSSSLPDVEFVECSDDSSACLSVGGQDKCYYIA